MVHLVKSIHWYGVYLSRIWTTWFPLFFISEDTDNLNPDMSFQLLIHHFKIQFQLKLDEIQKSLGHDRSGPFSDPCFLPMEIGPCQSFDSRWYFNADKGHCIEFFFGGCDGNTNNFKTKYECEKMCIGDTSGNVILFFALSLFFLIFDKLKDTKWANGCIFQSAF